MRFDEIVTNPGLAPSFRPLDETSSVARLDSPSRRGRHCPHKLELSIRQGKKIGKSGAQNLLDFGFQVVI